MVGTTDKGKVFGPYHNLSGKKLQSKRLPAARWGVTASLLTRVLGCTTGFGLGQATEPYSQLWRGYSGNHTRTHQEADDLGKEIRREDTQFGKLAPTASWFFKKRDLCYGDQISAQSYAALSNCA
jgi:hypothetical protein